MTKRKVFTTKKGVAFYPHLRKPEVFEGTDVGYTCKLMLTPSETEELKALLESELEVAKKLPEFSGKKWTKPTMGMGEDKDGNVIFKFKKTSQFKTKTGEVIHTTVPIFDASGKAVPETVDPSNGSIVRVGFSIYPFYKSSAVHGLSLRLEAVQVLELKEYGVQKADSYGFGVEEGYTAKDDDEIPFDVDEKEDADESSDF